MCLRHAGGNANVRKKLADKGHNKTEPERRESPGHCHYNTKGWMLT